MNLAIGAIFFTIVLVLILGAATLFWLIQDRIRRLQTGLKGELLELLNQTSFNNQQKMDQTLSQNRQESFQYFEKIQEHLQSAEQKLSALHGISQSVTDLNQLLKLPHLRGGFGEAALERLLSDFLPLGSYELQAQISKDSTERVDALIKIARQRLPVDSKFPREQILPLFESSQPKDLEIARKTLGELIKIQAKSIASKYIRTDCGTTDMAFLFLPSETLYFEVIRNGELFEALNRLKVFPVSPNTLAISLRSITLAQEYYEMACGVSKTIEDIHKARRWYDLFESKFEEIGKSLKKAQESFDTSQNHLNRYQHQISRLKYEPPN